MFSQLLIKTFVPDYQNTKNQNVRKRYGYLGGVVGIVVNLLLFAVKFLAGLTVNSIALMADAFNNLSDVASSVITIFGFVLAGKPADEEHPFGYGRIEYIAGLIVSFLVILIGYEFIKTSIERILHPETLEFNLLVFGIVIISILLKGWLGLFNKKLGLAIDSHALSASSFDSFSDMISTGCVAVSLLASRWTDLPLDGYIGVIVAGIILYAGFSLTKDTISPLLGDTSHKELAREITDMVLGYEGIENVHDLIIHNYGPGRYMVSLHAEVPAQRDIMELHELIDKVEREVARHFHVVLTIHLDPVNKDTEENRIIREEIGEILCNFPAVQSYHDLRFVGRGNIRNVLFDIVVKPGLGKNEEKELRRDICQAIQAVHPGYVCIIHVDREYN